MKYLQGLARTLLTKGAVLRPFTAVDEIVQTGGTVAVKTRNGQTILARDVVCATNAPIAGRLTLQAKMAPYRSYAMAFEVPKGSIADALYWDTLDAYHYVRLQPGDTEDFLIVGGEDHKTGEADDAAARFERLEKWTRDKFGEVGTVTHRWSGQVLEPVDFAGYVGRDPDNDRIYFVTGDSGTGDYKRRRRRLIDTRSIRRRRPSLARALRSGAGVAESDRDLHCGKLYRSEKPG